MVGSESWMERSGSRSVSAWRRGLDGGEDDEGGEFDLDRLVPLEEAVDVEPSNS